MYNNITDDELIERLISEDEFIKEMLQTLLVIRINEAFVRREKPALILDNFEMRYTPSNN